MTPDDMRQRSHAAWERAEVAHYGDFHGAETARVRRVMLGCTLGMLAERQAVANDMGDLLAGLLLEISNLTELAEIMARAVALSEDRT